MQNDNNQYDIPRHQLLTAGEAQRTEHCTEIGEAVIVTTLFGKAKVRILRKRRESGLSLVLAAVAVAAVAGVFAWKELPRPSRATDSAQMVSGAAVAAQTLEMPSVPADPVGINADPGMSAAQNEPAKPSVQAVAPAPGNAASAPSHAPLLHAELAKQATTRQRIAASAPESASVMTGSERKKLQAPAAELRQTPGSAQGPAPASPTGKPSASAKPSSAASGVQAGPAQSVSGDGAGNNSGETLPSASQP